MHLLEIRRKQMKNFAYTDVFILMMLSFEKQRGLCAICNRPETSMFKGNVRRLAVDHDHQCCPPGRACQKCIRGLLCYTCNSGIGYLGDDPKRILAAARYLIRQASKVMKKLNRNMLYVVHATYPGQVDNKSDRVTPGYFVKTDAVQAAREGNTKYGSERLRFRVVAYKAVKK